ncbi:type IIL restriction-modification enzyme MmeI [Lactobacillus panisapium]|uniref:type IIL restriction-modification enzyme MmeI n=1 Tax=Lactobacillus panisapium TaxID=2012495 RepID=UPI0030136AD5
MHMTQIKAVEGKLKTHLRCSNYLCFNTFLIPPMSKGKQNEIEHISLNILGVREEEWEL